MIISLLDYHSSIMQPQMAFPWLIVILIVYVILSLVLTFCLTPSSSDTGMGPGEVKPPTADEGRELPVIFGTCRITSANVVWYGDIKKQKVKDSGQTIGYKYFVGLHMVVCHAPIYLDKIRVGKKDLWTPADGLFSYDPPKAYDTIYVAKKNLFGGKKREGGFIGYVDLMDGGASQPKNDYLMTNLGVDIPAFRGVFSVVSNRCNLGLNPNIKPWDFIVRRIDIDEEGFPPLWFMAEIVDPDGHRSKNPAAIIQECLQNRYWGMGIDVSRVDTGSFYDCALILESENLGISLSWDKQKTIEDFINEILKHIDGMMYCDPETGKFTMRLIRGNTGTPTGVILNEHNIQRIENWTRPSFGELTNSVTVNYTNGSTFEQGSVTVQDAALVKQQQNVINTTQALLGFTHVTQAAKAAERFLRSMSVPRWGGTLYCVKSESVSNLRPGDVFLLSWEEYGIVEMKMRALSINWGTDKEHVVRIQVVEDRFRDSFESEIGVIDPVTDPALLPAPCTMRAVEEMPYLEALLYFGAAIVDSRLAVANDIGWLSVCASPPNAAVISAEVAVNYGIGWPGDDDDTPTVLMSPYALCDGEMWYGDQLIPISDGYDLSSVKPGFYARIEDEIVRIDAISDTEMLIARGCMDTVPKIHADNTPIIFCSAEIISDAREYRGGDETKVRLLSDTESDQLALSSAPIDTIAFASRAVRPYPPGAIRCNDYAWPVNLPEDGLILEWAHRGRMDQLTLPLIGHSDETNYGPESGTTYELEIYDENGVQQVALTGLTGVTYDYADELTDLNTLLAAPSETILNPYTNWPTTQYRYNGSIRFVLRSRLGGLASTQQHDATLRRLGYGYSYGSAYGGKVIVGYGCVYGQYYGGEA